MRYLFVTLAAITFTQMSGCKFNFPNETKSLQDAHEEIIPVPQPLPPLSSPILPPPTEFPEPIPFGRDSIANRVNHDDNDQNNGNSAACSASNHEEIFSDLVAYLLETSGQQK